MLKTQRKVKKILLVPVFAVLISFAAPLFPVFTPSANALTGDDIVAQTQAWQLLSGIAFASGNHFRDTITTQQADACDFIKPGDAVYSDGAKVSGEDSYSIPVGYTVSSGDGLWNSGNPPTSGIQSALKYIGTANCTDFAKQLGYTISGANYKIPNNQQAIKDKANAFGIELAKKLNVAWGTAPNYMDYWALLNAFTLGCQAQYRQIYTPNDSISTGHSTDEINRNLEAQKNGDTANSGQGHYYVNVYRDGNVNLHVYYVGSNNFAMANVGYGLNKNEQAGVMGCTRDNQSGGLGVIRWWLSQHPEFAAEYKDKVKNDDPTAGQNATDQHVSGPGDSAKSSCSVDGVGWLVCPVINFLASVTDGMFSFLADSFLQTDVKLIDTSSGTYTAWGIMRNLANVAFVIVFLIIIYSQLTSVGLSNYGLKKLLPRLIIAAILVNTSYIICQLAVDLSNILGYGVKGLFDGIGAQVIDASGHAYVGVNGKGFDGWKSIAGVVLAGAAGVVAYSALGTLGAMLFASVIAILVIFLLLIVRQMLIILLIVIAPLAFVAFLLPNTEQYFKKWQKLFMTLLMLFPIIGVIFGASSLASTVLRTSYSSTDDSIKQIVAAGVLIIPLFIVPGLLKASLDGIGKIGARINSHGDKLAGQAGGLGGKLHGAGAGFIAAKTAGRGKFGRAVGRIATGTAVVGNKRAYSSMAAKYENEASGDIISGWERDGTLFKSDELARIAKNNPASSKGQAAMRALATKGDVEYLQDLRSHFNDKQKVAYDRAIASQFSNLKAKDPRAVFDMDEEKWDNIKQAEMHGMKDKALVAGADSSATFRQALIDAIADPEQNRNFSPGIQEHARLHYGVGTPPTRPTQPQTPQPTPQPPVTPPQPPTMPPTTPPSTPPQPPTTPPQQPPTPPNTSGYSQNGSGLWVPPGNNRNNNP